MPRTEVQNAEIRANTKNRIVLAAMKLFAQNGYEATSVNAIAIKAKVSKGLIYNHFNTKEDFIPAILQSLAEMSKDIRKTMQEDHDPRQKLKLLIDEGFQALRDQAELLRWLMPLAFEIKKHLFVNDLFVQQLKESNLVLQQIFRHLGYANPKEETRILSTLITGVKFEMAIRNDYDLDEMHQLLLSKYKLNNI